MTDTGGPFCESKMCNGLTRCVSGSSGILNGSFSRAAALRCHANTPCNHRRQRHRDPDKDNERVFTPSQKVLGMGSCSFGIQAPTCISLKLLRIGYADASLCGVTKEKGLRLMAV
jgi:hypothetical protein